VEDIQRQLGENIRALRSAAGFTQDGFAELAGLGRAHMGEIERGECSVNIRTLKIIADALKITVSDVVRGI
jgi:transcriptional regulator with XRE-family HTH domain